MHIRTDAYCCFAETSIFFAYRVLSRFRKTLPDTYVATQEVGSHSGTGWVAMEDILFVKQCRYSKWIIHI